MCGIPSWWLGWYRAGWRCDMESQVWQTPTLWTCLSPVFARHPELFRLHNWLLLHCTFVHWVPWIIAVIVIADVASPSIIWETATKRRIWGDLYSLWTWNDSAVFAVNNFGALHDQNPPLSMILLSHHLHISTNSSLNYHSFCVSVGGNQVYQMSRWPTSQKYRVFQSVRKDITPLTFFRGGVLVWVFFLHFW